ncbi:MAG: glucose-6-phosphate isomerase, partial [Deltaproteobacteria bacterium]|nr:glucose-6-phosphate isomerase [Deltaproteobacteria bacterium]
YEAVLLLGTGGSSLGAACLIESLAQNGGSEKMRLEIVEDLHPSGWKYLTSSLSPDKTFMIVVSKSGKTIETLAAFLFFRQWMIEALGEAAYRRSVLFITDPNRGPLREIAASEKIETLPVPPGVGGRYSVLSTVGLLPAACVGIEVKSLLAGARRMDERCEKQEVWTNPAMMLAALHYLISRKKGKTIRIVMPYHDRLRGYSSWFAQLWAESLGKRISLKGEEVRAGMTPVRAEGPIDQHSQLQLYLEGPRDKTVTFISVERSGATMKLPRAYENHPELSILGGKDLDALLRMQRQATEAALCDAGCPNLTLGVKEITPDRVGQLLYLAEVETVFTGALYDINPFDQPGVEGIKNYIRGLMGVSGFDKQRQAIDAVKKDRRYVI